MSKRAGGESSWGKLGFVKKLFVIRKHELLAGVKIS
jgi:hypothetical protein